jgi:hypothetical protein
VAEPSIHGQIGGEITNVVGEAGSFLGAAGRSSAGTVVGGIGEGLYALSGMAGLNAAADKMADDLASASPSSTLDILGHSYNVLQGISNTVSGAAGVASAAGVGGTDLAQTLGKTSSSAWAVSEGMNALRHAKNFASSLYASGGSLDKEQGVHFGQFVGSAIKLTGIGLSLSGGSPTTAASLQAGGSAVAVLAGSLNLYQKGYTPTATMNYLGNKVSNAASSAGSTLSNMMPGRNPNPEPDSAV